MKEPTIYSYLYIYIVRNIYIYIFLTTVALFWDAFSSRPRHDGSGWLPMKNQWFPSEIILKECEWFIQ